MATPRDSIGAKLFMNKSLADVWFVIDGEEIPGHKLVLSLECPYVERTLYGQINEVKPTRIVLKRPKATIFKEVLRFCYLKDVVVTDWTVQNLIDLLTLAREYQLEPLVEQVADIIGDRLSVEVFREVFGAAKVLDLPKLLETCLSVADFNVQTVLNSSNFKEYPLDLVCALIERPNFYTQSREMLAALSSWRTGHTESELKMVLKKVDWQRVSQAQLSIITQELITTHAGVLNLSFWDKLKLGGASQEGDPVELLTLVKYEHDSGKVGGSMLYSAVGETQCQASKACQERNLFGNRLYDLSVRFKRGGRFRVDRVEIRGPACVERVLFNGQRAPLSSSMVNLRTTHLAKFSTATCKTKDEQDNVLDISGVGIVISCDIFVHGILC